MISIRLSTPFLFALLALMLACGGSATQSPPPPSAADVYAAGFEKDVSGTSIAKYWKNGEPVVLGMTANGSYATSIVVSGNDVYVAGIEGNGTNDVAKYWKNGVAAELSDGTRKGFANSIFVSGSDVFVAGGELSGSQLIAEYWKNGVPVVLSDNGNGGALAQSIWVSGSDVYVAGWMFKTWQIDPTHTLNTKVAAYWKNGVPVELPDNHVLSIAYSVFVSGNDLYVAGYSCQVLTNDCALTTYWKNEVPVQLTNATDTTATSIAVSGNDIYVAQNQASAASELWKNGNSSRLTKSIAANQVVVSGKDVYVGGAMVDSFESAAYWKNGDPVAITDGTHAASVFGLAVVQH